MTAQSSNSVPLSALLSQTLVAFTIEFDNEAERRLPHSTATHGATQGTVYAPWLVSMAMWFNCMRFVGEDGITVRELERAARTPTNLAGMQRWGYVSVAPDQNGRANPPRSAWVVRARPAGKLAQSVWRPLLSEIEGRWKTRFGAETLQRLRSALEAVADPGLPECMPVLGYGLRCAERLTKLAEANSSRRGERATVALLAQVLLAFALEFEESSEISLAIYANLLRVLHEAGVRARDLPLLTGVSKEGLKMAMGILRKRSLAAEPASKAGKVVYLTDRGRATQKRCGDLLAATENSWIARFGAEPIAALRASLEGLVGDGSPQRSPLFKGLEPYPEGWRAAIRRPETLPHFPMVLHRGGYPDGS